MVPQPAAAVSSLRPRITPPHAHVGQDTCPTCDQAIPPEKLEEIRGKIAAREHEQTRAITALLEEQYTVQKVRAEAKAKADLEQERQRSASREAIAREEARTAAEAAAAKKLAEAERIRKDNEASLQHQIAAAERARMAAEQAGASLQTQFQRLRQDSETAIAAVKTEAQTREAEIRSEAQQTAEAALAEKISEIEKARVQSEIALRAKITEAEANQATAEQKGAALQRQLDDLLAAKQAEITKIKEDAAAEAQRIYKEAIDVAQAQAREQLAEKDMALADAQAKNAQMEEKLANTLEQQELTLKQQLDAQREILEKAKDDAINAEKAKAFDENQKLSTRVNELQRALDKKTNEELGEGAEVDLYEALKTEFPDDQIERIGRGEPGADIRHLIRHNGRDCGLIIYDSKNHKQFRDEHVAKLARDQLAARAEHAILSTHRFPRGARQLHVRDGVLLANPARVVTVVSMIRQHMLQTHTLRISNAEREEKTAKLYAFITSERCTQLLGRIDTQTDELLEHLVTEKKWQEKSWKKRGEAYCSIQKAKADLATEIGCIIGTGVVEAAAEDTEL